MNIDYLTDMINEGHEIEFFWNKMRFSITYGEINGEEVISFCEFNEESTEVLCTEDLLKIKRYGITVAEMISSIEKNDMRIY